MKGCFTYTGLGTKGVRWSSDGKKIAVGIVGLENGRAVDMVRVFDISQCDSKHPNIMDTFPGPRFQMKGYGDNPVIPYFDWNGETLFLLNSSIRNGGYGYLYSYNLESHLAEAIDPIGTTCCYRDTRWSPDGTYILFAYQDFNLTGSQAAIKLYYIPYGTLGTGVKYTPFNLPGGFFKTPSERILASLRPDRSAK
jgi:Tol biopolymer transport system component